MIAIVKYNAGNILSVQNALKRLHCESILTDDPEDILASDKVIFPGVGEAKSAMEYLKNKQLDKTITSIKQPFLGICLGLQLMCRHTEEGDVDCLNIFNTHVRAFPKKGLVPHMGWNDIDDIQKTSFISTDTAKDVYFVHSYYADICENTIATCNYIVPFSAALQGKNYYATQFHPEKSGSVGEKILQNFLNL